MTATRGAIRLTATLTLVLLTAGCAGEQPNASADCTARIRLDGGTYSGYGTSSRAATEHAVAEEAECHDVGADAEGSVFPDDAGTVPVSRFDGYSPEDVLGVAAGRDSYVVFLSESLSSEERDRLLDALAPAGS